MPHKTESRSSASKKREQATQESPNPTKRRRVARIDDLEDSSALSEASTLSGKESQTTWTSINQTETSVKEKAEAHETPSTGRLRTKKRRVEVTAQEADSVISSKRKIAVKKVEAVLVKEEQGADVVGSPQRPRRTKNVGSSTVEQQTEEEIIESPVKSRKSKKSLKIVQAKEKGGEEAEQASKKVKKHRKTKEEKEAEAMPLAARTNGLRMFIGAHVSCAKGVQNSVTNAVHIGGNSFALFLKSQRKWDNPPLQDEHKAQFLTNCTEHKYEAAKHILPHGSYLVNLAQDDPDKAKQAYDAFIDDLRRCEALGIKLYNFHPGNTGPHPRAEAISRIAGALNRAHKETSIVKPVLENMAGKGNVIGATFEDLRDIIEQVEDKTRIGVCIDTCHSFAAGYDLRTPEAFKNTLDKFDEVVGMKYLSALHINDSKAPFDSHRDLHQNIGLGFLGLRAFHNVMNEPRFEGLPLVLETPIERKNEEGKVVEDKNIWATEIKLLESLIGMDPESHEFKNLEADLAARGTEERKKLQDAYERKMEKDRKAAEKGPTKGRRKKKHEEREDSLSSLNDISD